MLDTLKDKIENFINNLPAPVLIFIRRLNENDLERISGYASFFLIMSIIPMFIALLAIIPFTVVSADDLVRLITIMTPDFANGIIASCVDAAYEQSVGLISISLVVAIWSASKGTLGVMNGLSDIADVKEKRNWFYARFWSIVYTIALLVILFAMLMLLVFGNQIHELIESIFPQLGVLWDILMTFKFVLVLVPAMIILAIMYTFVPMKKITVRSRLTGALCCVIAWGVLSWGFFIYVALFGSHSIYGALATPILFMLWLNLCVYILFIGAMINETLSEWLAPKEEE